MLPPESGGIAAFPPYRYSLSSCYARFAGQSKRNPGPRSARQFKNNFELGTVAQGQPARHFGNETSAITESAFDPNTPSMRLDYLPGDPQAKAETAESTAWLRLFEKPKDAC